jgi:hypothetical protein
MNFESITKVMTMMMMMMMMMTEIFWDTTQ